MIGNRVDSTQEVPLVSVTIYVIVTKMIVLVNLKIYLAYSNSLLFNG